MIGEIYTPPMYRDAISSGMPMFEFDPEVMGMGSMYGGMGMGMYGNTNLLGGVRLQPNLSQDTVHILKAKEKESTNSMLNFGKLALGVIAFTTLAGLLKGKKVPWYKRSRAKISNSWGTTKGKVSSGWSWLKGHTPSRPTGVKKWYNPFTWIRKSPTP